MKTIKQSYRYENKEGNILRVWENNDFRGIHGVNVSQSHTTDVAQSN